MSPLLSKPSNWLSSSNMVRWISRSPPLLLSYLHRHCSVTTAKLSSGWDTSIRKLTDMPTTQLGHSPLGAHGVDLVYEDNAGAVLVRHTEQFPHLKWNIAIKNRGLLDKANQCK